MTPRDLLLLDPRGRKLAVIDRLTGPEVVGWRAEAAHQGRTLADWEHEALTRRELDLRRAERGRRK